jgi:hypothetical protein
MALDWCSAGASEMDKQQQGGVGFVVGALVVLAAVVFIVTGGSLGGKKTIESDRDLPPVASETAPGK